jgi:hypothetical protein
MPGLAMSEPPTSNKPAPLWKSLLRTGLPLEHETALFVLVSALDVLMTYILLSQRGFQFYESNPLARWFVDGWGLKGMVAYKFSLVAVVCLITQIIAAKRLNVARRLLQFAIVAAALVVIYSLTLLLRHA